MTEPLLIPTAAPTTNGYADESHRLSYPCGAPHGPGAVREVAADALWLRTRLPLALNHINLWAIDHEGGYG
jgi:hypothetical protein